MKKIFLTISLIFSLSGIVHAGLKEAPVGHPIRIYVLVSSADSTLTANGERFFIRELKKFKDIEIVLEKLDCDWYVDLIVSRLPLRASVSQDYAFSLLAMQPIKSSGLYAFEGHELSVGVPNLQDGCENLARNFAKKYLGKKIKESILPSY